MRPPHRRSLQDSEVDPRTLTRTRFVVELRRLEDGTPAGRVTAFGNGGTEEFRGWRALLALLADDQSGVEDRHVLSGVDGSTWGGDR